MLITHNYSIVSCVSNETDSIIDVLENLRKIYPERGIHHIDTNYDYMTRTSKARFQIDYYEEIETD